MDIKVTVGLDIETKIILERLINALDKPEKTSSKKEFEEGKSKEKVVPTTPVEQEDTQNFVTVEEVVEDIVENEDELRKKIKALGIQLVQKGKSAKVKQLTADYDCKKMDELPSHVLQEYFDKLEKL